MEKTAHELEQHLMAPCCWRETLDVHESPIATELRREIRRRLAAGEDVTAIEASLTAHYGARLRTTLPGDLGYALAAVVILGNPAILWWLWRRRRGRPPAAAASTPATALPEDERRRCEDRLDDELAML